MFALAKAGISNLLVGNLFLIAQFFVLMSIFFIAFSKQHRPLFLFFGSLAFLLVVIGSFMERGLHFSLSSVFTGVSVLVLCMIYFYRTLRDLPIVEIHKDSVIWIVIAALVCYSGTILIFIINNYLLHTSISTHPWLWAFHNFLNILKNILFTIAIWRDLRNSN